MKVKQLCKKFTSFLKDQSGMEALQTVIIIAIAALVLVGAAAVAKKGNGMMDKNVRALETAVNDVAADGDNASGGAQDDFDDADDELFIDDDPADQ